MLIGGLSGLCPDIKSVGLAGVRGVTRFQSHAESHVSSETGNRSRKDALVVVKLVFSKQLDTPGNAESIDCCVKTLESPNSIHVHVRPPAHLKANSRLMPARV